MMLYLSFGEMGHHALAGSTSYLTQQWRRTYGSMGNVSGREVDVGGLRGKGVSRHPQEA